MSTPLFIVGLQRSGTTVTARLLCSSEQVGDGRLGFCPCDRWDVLAAMELGAETSITPWLNEIGKYLACLDNRRYRLVKLALPFTISAMRISKLAERWPHSRIVIVERRCANDHLSSWKALGYLRNRQSDHVFWVHRHLFERAVKELNPAPYVLCYEDLVIQPHRTASLLCQWLGIEPLSAKVCGIVNRPKNWSLCETLQEAGNV